MEYKQNAEISGREVSGRRHMIIAIARVVRKGKHTCNLIGAETYTYTSTSVCVCVCVCVCVHFQ